MSQKSSEKTINSETMFREAARITLRIAFEKMSKSTAATRDGVEKKNPSDAEVKALHDMRVGSRRLRAALSVFARIFPKDEYREIEQEVARITDALSTVRDLDVQRDTLAKLAADLPESEKYGIERFRLQLAKMRDSERKKLRKTLGKYEKSRFEKKFLRALSAATRIKKDTK